jgi:L-threonylcarbamoyladenylate synthase
VLLRPGGISRAALAQALGEPPRDRDADAPALRPARSPRTTRRATALALLDAEALVAEVSRPANVAVLALQEPPLNARVVSWITAAPDATRYGHDLYANLRKLDASGAKRILVEAPPDIPGGKRSTTAWSAPPPAPSHSTTNPD